MKPKFIITKDAAGFYRFRLADGDGVAIAFSKGYFSKQACLSDIDSVKEQAPDGEIEDKTAYPAEN
jgi:uncharacterized protein YegP (UPF0339 family)